MQRAAFEHQTVKCCELNRVGSAFDPIEKAMKLPKENAPGTSKPSL